MSLIEDLEDRSARIAVCGIGYVGLPLACAFAEAGFVVDGIDVDAEKVAGIREGRSHVDDVPSARVRELVEDGRLRAHETYEPCAEADAVVICVPTPLRKTRDPDISYVLAATDEVASRVRAGQLVVLESTTYPGTTDEILVPAIEERGLEVGRDVFCAHSPERIDPGNETWGLENTPKVVGGMTGACLERALALYGAVCEETVPVSSPGAAEMVKLLENTYRAVNIGLANEVCRMCDRLGLDVWEIVDAAATKPFGFVPFRPGPGLGGHCIPVDPHYLSWKMRLLDESARLVDLATDINRRMPAYVVERSMRVLNDVGKAVRGSDVLVCGVAYKPDVSDVRESPAMDVIERLEDLGASCAYADPHVPTLAIGDRTLEAVPLDDLEAAAGGRDLVVICTDHEAVDHEALCGAAARVLDCRNATGGLDLDHVVKL